MKRIEAFLLLFSACYLQRIDILGTSLGFIVIVILLAIAASRAFHEKRFRMQTSAVMYSYPLFIFAFIFPPFFSLSELNFEVYIPFTASLIVWMYLLLQGAPSTKDFAYRPAIWVILIFLGYALVSDFSNMISASEQSLKKNFEFANPNFTGFLINILTTIFLLGEKGKSNNKWTFMLASTLLVVLSLSKTAYILQGLILGVQLGKRALIIAIIGATAAFTFGITLITETTITTRTLTFFENDVPGAITHRIDLIKSAWNIFCDNPLFGIGYGNYLKFAFFMYDSPFAVKTHNIILTILSERGLFGFFLLGLSQMILWLNMSGKWNANLILIYSAYWAFSLSHAIGETLVVWPIIIHLLSDHSKNHTST